LGDYEVRTQFELPTLIRGMVNELNIEKLIFVGASSGGFAALFFSHSFSNSLAIAINPQTILNDFDINSKNNQYSLICHPKLGNEEELPGVKNLVTLYQVSIPNYVVYIQNSTAFRDLYHHAIPFLSGLQQEILGNRILPKINNWGLHGHRASVPATEHMSWLKTAIEAKNFEAETMAKLNYLKSEDEIDKIFLKQNIAYDYEDRIAKELIN